MIPTIIVTMLVMFKEREKVCPTNPSIAPPTKNPPILPAWNDKWVLRSHFVHLVLSA